MKVGKYKKVGKREKKGWSQFHFHRASTTNILVSSLLVFSFSAEFLYIVILKSLKV